MTVQFETIIKSGATDYSANRLPQSLRSLTSDLRQLDGGDDPRGQLLEPKTSPGEKGKGDAIEIKINELVQAND